MYVVVYTYIETVLSKNLHLHLVRWFV